MNPRIGALALFVSLVGVVFAGCLSPEDADGQDPAPPTVADDVRVEPETLQGRLVCGIGAHRTTLNPCVVMGKENRNVFSFDVRPGLKTLIVGLRWDATTDLGDELQVLIETKDYGFLDRDESHRYAAESGPSDLVVRIDDDHETHGDWSWSNMTSHRPMQVRVFAPASLPPSVVVDQSFTLVIVSYHGAAAPMGADPFAVAGVEPGKALSS